MYGGVFIEVVHRHTTKPHCTPPPPTVVLPHLKSHSRQRVRSGVSGVSSPAPPPKTHLVTSVSPRSHLLRLVSSVSSRTSRLLRLVSSVSSPPSCGSVTSSLECVSDLPSSEDDPETDCWTVGLTTVGSDRGSRRIEIMKYEKNHVLV